MSTEHGNYIYGVIASGQRQEFGPIGIGDKGDTVYTVPHQDISAIVSRSPIIKYPVNREHTTTHARILEQATKTATVLPVRFGTISTNEEEIVEKVLKPRYQEFVDLLRKMEGKTELGTRVRWNNMDAIFAEIVAENQDIKTLKESALQEKNAAKKQADSVKIGQQVQEKLDQKKKKEANELLDALKPLSVDYRELQIYGDMNLVNASFLVVREREQEFDQKINDLQQLYEGRKQINYSSPTVPYSFVEIVIRW